MTNDWAKIIKAIAPHGNPAIIRGLANAMPEVIKIAELTSSQRLAQFLAQIAHESDGFKTTVEYASGRAYNGRADLGNRKGTNDGVTFKGRGLIQLTGRDNYTSMSRKLGVDLVGNPSLAAQFPYAAMTAAQFWKDKGLNTWADVGNINAITKRINGGYNGLDARKMYYARAQHEVSDIKMAQRRLHELNYPPGKLDGVSGPLMRSAVRDFQDAAGLPTSGVVDHATKSALFSDAAPARPVSAERAAMSAQALIDGGSTIAAGTQEAKSGILGAGVATAATAAGQVKELSDQVAEIKAGVESGVGMLQLAREYWYVGAIAVLTVVCIFLLWRAYKGAAKAQESRVQTARDGTNVRV